MPPTSSSKIKLVMLGESFVGKSSLVFRFIRGDFCELQETIGAAFLTKNMIIGDTIIEFQIWDTAGQERYQAIGNEL